MIHYLDTNSRSLSPHVRLVGMKYRGQHVLTTTFEDATILFISSQIHAIIFFFLSKNIRIARDRAWDYTVKSRGKGPEFWQPYVEEWQKPPSVEVGGRTWEKWVGNWLQRYIVQKGDL